MIVNDANRNRRTIAILAVICGVIQVAFAPNLGILSGRANLCLVFCACIAFTRGGTVGVVSGFLAGLFYDLQGAGPIGLMAFELTVCSYFLGLGERNLMAADPKRCFRIYVVAAAAVALVYQIGLALVGQGGAPIEVIFMRWLPSVVCDAIAFLPFLFILSRSGAQGPTNLNRRGSKSGKGSAYSLKGL